MGFEIPRKIVGTCDHNDCKNKIEIIIRYIQSGFRQDTLAEKVRKEGWYYSKKKGLLICPDCRDKMGLRISGRKPKLLPPRTHAVTTTRSNAVLEGDLDITKCSDCNCMTKTIEGKCGKCGNRKVK